MRSYVNMGNGAMAVCRRGRLARAATGKYRGCSIEAISRSCTMTPHASPPADPAPAAEEDPPTICPILTLAGETFARDLPELLRDHAGEWTAYHGATRLGITKTYREVHELGRARGIHL